MVKRHVLFVFYLIFSLIQAAPIESPNIRDHTLYPRALEHVCGFEGNSDIYGLGIRLGLYMQWLSAYFLRELFPESVTDLASVTFIFEFALFTAAVALTRENSETYSMEIMILVAMLMGDVWLVHVPISFPFHRRSNATAAAVLARSLMIFAIAIFAVWFAATGSLHYRRDPCGTYLFLFGKIRIESLNMAYICFQAMTVVHLLVAVALCFYSLKPIHSTERAFLEDWSSIRKTVQMLLLPMSIPISGGGADKTSLGQPREAMYELSNLSCTCADIMLVVRSTTGSSPTLYHS